MTLNNPDVLDALLRVFDGWTEQKAAMDAENAAMQKQAQALLSQAKATQDQAKAAQDQIFAHIEQTQAHGVSSANLDDLREFLRALVKALDVEEDDATE